MSAAPSEPEKYSIDEMMERLKSNSSESSGNGELVTRDDGTQAIKVRKRKRRSSQTKKEEAKRSKRARIFQVVAALILLFLAVLGIGGAMVFANSSPFREQLVQRMSQASGAAVNLTTFRMNPKTANAGTLTLKWPEGNVLDNLAMNGLVAEISPTAFLGNSFKGEEVTAAEGHLTLRAPQSAKPLLETALHPGKPLLQFSRYRIPNFNASFGTQPASSIHLSKSEASLAFNAASGQQQLRLYKGGLDIPGWPKLRLDRALLEFSGNESKILSLRVMHETDDKGRMDFEGTVLPYPSDHLSKLDLKLDSFQLSGILGAQLGRLFSGRIHSRTAMDSNFLTFSPSEKSSAVFEAAFTGSPGSSINLQGFPFLFALSQDLEDEWYERPSFESDVSGILHRENGIVSLRDLSIENKGKLMIKGALTMTADGALSGDLEVGLTDSMVATAKTLLLGSAFGETKEGYRWIRLKISGTSSTPVDDFKDQLSAAETKPQGGTKAGGSKVPSFEELSRPR